MPCPNEWLNDDCGNTPTRLWRVHITRNIYFNDNIIKFAKMFTMTNPLSTNPDLPTLLYKVLFYSYYSNTITFISNVFALSKKLEKHYFIKSNVFIETFKKTTVPYWYIFFKLSYTVWLYKGMVHLKHLHVYAPDQKKVAYFS